MGKPRYGLACQEDGGTIDDLIVNRMGPEDFLVVSCNGLANREAVVNHAALQRPAARVFKDTTTLANSTMVRARSLDASATNLTGPVMPFVK